MKSLEFLLLLLSLSTLFGCESKYETKYYDNGNLKSKVASKDGVYNGSFFTYFPDGNLATKGEWKNGEGNGYEERYFEKGGLKQAAYYSNGKLNGLAMVYHDNGVVRLRAQFKDGVKTGKYLIYSREGKLIEVHLYGDDGSLHYLTKWGPEGAKVMELVFPIFSVIENDDSLRLEVRSPIPYYGRGELKIGYKRKSQSIEGIVPSVILKDTTAIGILIPKEVDIMNLYYSFDFVPVEPDTLARFFFDHRVLSEKSNDTEFGS